MSKKGLGRGLSTLIPEPIQRQEPRLASDQSKALYDSIQSGGTRLGKKGPTELAIDLLEAGPYQPRSLFDEGALQDLATSIKKNGIIQPIIVGPMNEKGKHPIIAGERRWRASQLCGLISVPAIIKDLTDLEALEIALIENIQRKDLTVIEEAEGYKRLIDEFNYTQEQLANELGKSRSHVTNILRLLGLPDDVKDMLNRGEISMGHARALLTAEDPRKIAGAIVNKGLNVREVEQLMRREKERSDGPTSKKTSGPRKKPQADLFAVSSELHASSPSSHALAEKSDDILEIEHIISTSIGAPVDIQCQGQSGTITLMFNSLVELDVLLKRLRG